jgi:outer membrane protein OmpA-like peptidoglycan-associated protein
MAETIGRQTASYRQGLVLGLTLAEIMLLLVFCMLIAVGAALVKERHAREAVDAQLKEIAGTAAANAAMVDSIARNPDLAELLNGSAGAASRSKIDELWRTLVENDHIVVTLEKEGVPRVALRDKSATFAKMQELLNRAGDPDKLVRALALQTAIEHANGAFAKLTPSEIAALLEKGQAAGNVAKEAGRGPGGHNWPPIINLSEAAGYYFATGSADLTPDFDFRLRTSVVQRLLAIATAFDVDVIEVIGHTDEQPVGARASNLDRSLPLVTQGETDAGAMQWADNAGLGLARALAVVRVLSSDFRLQNFQILPLSAAQLIDTDGRLTRWDNKGDVRERRRIEIRMRKSA